MAHSPDDRDRHLPPIALRDDGVMAVLPLFQINLVVADMPGALAFYRRLGWEIATPMPEHASARMPSGLSVEFDTAEFAAQ